MITVKGGYCKINAGDTNIISVPLDDCENEVTSWADWNLYAFFKLNEDDTDEEAVIQKITGTGITTDGDNAIIEFVYPDTVEQRGVKLLADIRGENIITGAAATFNKGFTVEVGKTIVQHTEATIPIYTTTPAQFADEVYYTPDITGLTGGGDTNLDGLATTGLTVGRIQIVHRSSTGADYRYILQAGNVAESEPLNIRSDDNPTTRYWRLETAYFGAVFTLGKITAVPTTDYSFEAALQGPNQVGYSTHFNANLQTGMSIDAGGAGANCIGIDYIGDGMVLSIADAGGDVRMAIWGDGTIRYIPGVDPSGSIGIRISSVTPTAQRLVYWQDIAGAVAVAPTYANDSAASSGGLSIGDLYFTGTKFRTRTV